MSDPTPRYPICPTHHTPTYICGAECARVTLDRADVERLLWIVPNAVGHRHRPLWERIRAALAANGGSAPIPIEATGSNAPYHQIKD